MPVWWCVYEYWVTQHLDYITIKQADDPPSHRSGTGRRGQDTRPRKRMPLPSDKAPFSRATNNGALDNRAREGRCLAAARRRLIDHLGGNPSTTQLYSWTDV